MIEFGYILIIIFELIITFIVVSGIILLEKKVKNRLCAINTQANETLFAVKNLRSNLKNFNKYFNEIKKIDIRKIKEAIILILDVVNFILLIKSVDFRNLKKAKNLKKLIPFGLIKKLLFTFKTKK